MTDFITTKGGLLIPTASFEEAVKVAPELQEIATIDRDFNRVFFGNVLRNEDDTLLTRGSAKGLRIYDELERDTHAYSVLQKRKLAIVAREWEVAPATESANDQLAADLVTEVLKAIQFDRICIDLLDATNKGFSVGEIMWDIKPSSTLGHDVVMPKDVIARDQRRFRFDKQSNLRLLVRENLTEGIPLPDRKFIVHRFGAKDGSPYGLGLGNKLFWPVFFKRQDIGFWLTFADKFGAPTAIGKYPRGAQKQEQEKLLSALRAIANDVGIIVPAGTEVELLEAARAGSIDTYERLARYMDEQMSEAVLGESNSTSATGATIGNGQANEHNEVRTEISQADSDLLSDTLSASLVKWVVDYNMPGAGYPKVTRNFEEEEDLSKRAERDERILKLGFEPDEQYILDTYGPGWKKSAPKPPPTFGTPPAFSEAEGAQRTDNRAAQDAMATAAASFSEQWEKLVGGRVTELLAILDTSKDLVEFRERIADLVDVEPPKALVEALARAGFGANMNARTDRTRGN